MWVKMHDGMPEDPDVDALTDAAFRLYVSGICYAAREQTDGYIPTGKVPRLTPRHKTSAVRELVQAGLWNDTVVEGGYLIRNFEKYQKTRDYWQAEAARVQAYRARKRTLAAVPHHGAVS